MNDVSKKQVLIKKVLFILSKTYISFLLVLLVQVVAILLNCLFADSWSQAGCHVGPRSGA